MSNCSEFEKTKEVNQKRLVSFAEVHNKTKAGLEAAREENQKLVDAATPLVDSLVPPGGENAEASFQDRLRRASAGFRSYVEDTARSCVSEVLVTAKALMPDQDMTPFATGIVPGVGDDRFAAIEDQVRPVADAVIERLEL